MAEKSVQTYKKECTHHWVIEPASGGDSKGKCKKCKRVREFSNSGWTSNKASWSSSLSNKESKENKV